MTGSEAQVEWAERLRAKVGEEFDRVAAALSSTLAAPSRKATRSALLAVLEDNRAEVMSNDRAGYFITQWQEPGEQVRAHLLRDPRYAAIRAAVR